MRNIIQKTGSGRMFGLASKWREAGYYPVLFALLLLVLLVQIARLFWVAVTPIGPVGEWRPVQPATMSEQARATLFASFDPFYRSGVAANDSEVVTSLQLELFGIRVNEGSGMGSAIIAGPDGVQESYAVGDEIMPGVTLASVAFDHVLIERGGVRESLYIDQSVPAEIVRAAPATTSAAAMMTAPPSVNNDAILSAASIKKDVDFSPRDSNGKITGISVAPKGAGAAFRAAGLQDGDIIVGVNGSPVKSASDIAILGQQIQPGAKLSLTVERTGQNVPLSVNIAQ